MNHVRANAKLSLSFCLGEGKWQECLDNKSSSHQSKENNYPIPPQIGTQSASNSLHMSHTGLVQTIMSQLTV